jgi:hypothetical protein
MPEPIVAKRSAHVLCLFREERRRVVVSMILSAPKKIA